MIESSFEESFPAIVPAVPCLEPGRQYPAIEKDFLPDEKAEGKKQIRKFYELRFRPGEWG